MAPTPSSSIDELLALPDESMAGPTPTPTPTPMATPLAVQTPAQPLGYLGAIPAGIGEGIDRTLGAFSSLGSALSGMYDTATSQGTWNKLAMYQANPASFYTDVGNALYSGGKYAVENPLKIVRTGGRAGSQLLFGLTGATLGAGIGGGTGAVAGSEVPVAGNVAGAGLGTVLGGAAGLGIGMTAGDRIYDSLENDIVSSINQPLAFLGYDTYPLPHPPKTGPEELKNFIAGSVSNTALDLTGRGALKVIEVAPKALGVTTDKIAEVSNARLPSASKDPFVPTDAQKNVVADVFSQAGVTPQMMEEVAAYKKNPVGLLDEHKSTADILDDLGYKDQAVKVKAIEQAAANSPGGQVAELGRQKAMVDKIQSRIDELMSSSDPSKLTEGQRLRQTFQELKDAKAAEWDELYKNLYKASDGDQYSLTQLGEALQETATKHLPPGYAASKQVIDKIIKAMTPEETIVGMSADGRPIVIRQEPTYNVRNLVAASGRLKDEARDLWNSKTSVGGREAAMNEEAARLVDKFIVEQTPYGDLFTAANKSRAEYADLFQQGAVASVNSPFHLPPEQIASRLTENTDQFVQGMKVFGGNPEATKALLNQKLTEFKNISDIGEKIKWLEKNAELFSATDAVPEVNAARDRLIRLSSEMKQGESLASDASAIDLRGVGLKDLTATAVTGSKNSLGALQKAAIHSTKQVGRDKLRQALGAGMKALGPLSTIPASVAGAVGTHFFGESTTQAVSQLNNLFVKALHDPEFAANDIMPYAGKADKLRAANATKWEGRANSTSALVDMLTTPGKRAAAVTFLDALRGNTPKKTPNSSAFNAMAKPTPAPAPTPTPQSASAKKEAVQTSSIDDLLSIADVPTQPATATPNPVKPNVPLEITTKVDKVAKEYDIDKDLMHAIVYQESKYNPKAESEKNARGLMQLMPSVAKSLDVKNVYDVEQNLVGGAKLYKELDKRFDGNIKLILAAYNWTPSKVDAELRKLREDGHAPTWENLVKYSDNLPDQTREYVPSVLALQRKFKS